MNRSSNWCVGIFGVLVLCAASQSVPAALASELGASAYPDLLELAQARALYEAGDLKRARAGYRHLAELGVPEARLELGVMLVRGEGGPADRAEGAAWVRWVAEDHPPLGAPVLEGLEPTLTAAEAGAAAEHNAALAVLRQVIPGLPLGPPPAAARAGAPGVPAGRQ